MREIEYKIGLSDETFFMAFAKDKGILSAKVGGIVARVVSLDEVNLRHIFVNPEYRGTERIGYALHEMMTTWAQKCGVERISLELIPKQPADYQATLKFIEKIGYVCTFEASEGYKFGFVLKLNKDASQWKQST